jgi:hypothetical protein
MQSIEERGEGVPASGDGQGAEDQPPPIRIEIAHPAHPSGTGPRFLVDQGHHNVHGLDDRFEPFGRVLRLDGYRVSAITEPFSDESLADATVLVIANALHESNVDHWEQPVRPAFTDLEIAAVVRWVEAGGRLWLIADHMPFPGAAATLAAELGFTFHDGFAFRSAGRGFAGGPITHTRSSGLVLPHATTDGRSEAERVEQVRSFVGQAFEAPEDAVVLLRMPEDGLLVMPEVAWEFDLETPRREAGGWPLAAVVERGRGRVAVFGEAAMLSARYKPTDGGWTAVGFHEAEARDNLQLVRNVARWLSEPETDP